MFLGIPAWTLMIGLLPFVAWDAQGIADYPTGLAIGLYVVFFLMYLSPKIAGLLDAMLTKGGVARYGGPLRFAASAAIEIVFSFLQGAVSTIRTSIFMVGLLFGKSVTWSGQSRDAYGISWRSAYEAMWPQVAFGVVVCGLLYLIAPTVLWWSLPLTAGYILSVPFGVITASPALGRWFKAAGLCGIPEDFDAPAEVKAIQGQS
jgi:membrane glycosyltransferase